MATYSVRSGETIYDVAAKLYKDTPLGIQDLLSLNSIDLDADDLYGEELTYTEGLKRNKPVFTVNTQSSGTSTYKTLTKQSVFDLAIQLYGDISQIRNLLEVFPNLDEPIPVGSEIEMTEQIDPIALFFTDRRIKVSTDIDPEESDEDLIATFENNTGMETFWALLVGNVDIGYGSILLSDDTPVQEYSHNEETLDTEIYCIDAGGIAIDAGTVTWKKNGVVVHTDSFSLGEDCSNGTSTLVYTYTGLVSTDVLLVEVTIG